MFRTYFNSLIFLVFGFVLNAQTNYFDLTEIVTDAAGIMTSQQLENLKAKLTNYESETSTQIVVLAVQDLEGISIEDYSLQVFNENELGQEGKDNGILILFSKSDRKVRIEVGYGLEYIITDLISSRIIRNIMIPEFKDENYYNGIDLGTSKIIELLNNPELANSFQSEESSKSIGTFTVFGRLFFGIFIAPLLLFISGFGYKLYQTKVRKKKFRLRKQIKKNKQQFYILLGTVFVVVISFPNIFLKSAIVIFPVLFLLIFLTIGLGLLYLAFNQGIKAFVGLFTGQLGIVPFLFFLPKLMLLLLAGTAFSMAPMFAASHFLFEEEVNKLLSDFNDVSYLLIGWAIVFFIISIGIAIVRIINDYKLSFGFSFFDNSIGLSIGSGGSSNNSSRGYSSSGSSSYSSSSSSSSFSGGGGSSGGGGASGSW